MHEMVIKEVPEFLAGGGELGKLIREFDWSTTSLGPVTEWPRSLRTCVQIMLTSRQPYWIGWGPDLIKLYNDPYKAIAGGKHPWALGKPASDVWKDIWRDIEPMLAKVMYHNEGTYVEEQLLIMERNGYPEETYYTFSYTPVAGDDGKTAGMICANSDDTDRILSERQLRTLTSLAKVLADARAKEDVQQKTVSGLASNPHDFPFVVFYEVSGKTAIKVAEGTESKNVFSNINLKGGDEISSAVDAALGDRNFRVLTIKKLGDLPRGAWPVPPTQAIVLPIGQRTQKELDGFLLIGLNPFRLLDEKYESFFQLVADQIATSLADVKAIEAERKRLEALAEIDRAKTTFFSNISHEFRTPLTLMLSPLENVIETAKLTDQQRTDLETSRRNTLRLQKLVNTLLDFSRIEAGKMTARFEAVDLNKFTEDLASSFRSAVEHAGIQYNVDIKLDRKEAAVDPDMWDKIVLNLISNAFKYTESGRIDVRLFRDGESFVFEVEDTGVGMSPENQTRIFERFYRVNNSGGRSQEGTGIGLSMVKELVSLHGGTITVSSQQGQGSTFTVRIPLRQEGHLSYSETTDDFKTSRSSYLDEVKSWTTVDQADTKSTSSKAEAQKGKSKVLVADDNNDMREYLSRLLAHDFQVLTAPNGEEAFQIASVECPDLILSDIMMPKLDGFGLLKKLRTNFNTRNIPVIFLSARAGEEAKIEGINAGADDYLVKPFSSKELLARVSNQIAISTARRQSEKQFFNLFLQSPAHIHVMRGPEHVFEFFHPLGKNFTGGKDFTGMSVRQALPEVEGQGYFEMLDQVYHEGKSFYIPESRAVLKNDKGELEQYFFNMTYLPWRDVDGKIIGVLQFSFDVTDQANQRRNIEEAESKLQNAIDLAQLGTWHIDLETQHVKYDKRVSEWWGLSADGAALDEVIRCIDAGDREKVSTAVSEAIERTGVYAAEYKLHNGRNGEERYITANGRVFYDEQKKPVRLSGIVRDVSLEKMAHAELERLVNLRTKELLQANVELRRSNEDLQQFAYVASHDLQEPLRKIQTFSELAQSRVKDQDAARTYLNKIDGSAARMSALIRDVLSYSQASRIAALNEKVDLNEIFENVKGDFELLIQQRKATVTADKLPVLRGSKLQFHQLLSNLIGNAIKFCGGDPIVKVEYSTVETVPDDLHVEDAPLYHRIAVTDNGIGFEQAFAEKIFQLFNRLHNRKEYEGTGIGLALCRKIVENHKGAITAYSEKGKGASFVIYLPASTAQSK